MERSLQLRVLFSIAGSFYLSANSSGRSYFYLLKQCLFGFKLTGTLTGKPKNTQRFSKKTVETERWEMSTGATSVDTRRRVMPVERFEPSTLAGLVFETSAYTVPPHRLICICRIYHSALARRCQYLNLTFSYDICGSKALSAHPNFPMARNF